MKPAPFDYRRPKSIGDAAALLVEHAGEARILAGGQTLVPMLNFRLAAPSMLVDINNIDRLDRIELRHDGLELGALVRWHEIETSQIVRTANPLLSEAGVRELGFEAASGELAGYDIAIVHAYHRDYAGTNWGRLAPVVLDARNAIDRAAVEASGSRYVGIGRPATPPV